MPRIMESKDANLRPSAWDLLQRFEKHISEHLFVSPNSLGATRRYLEQGEYPTCG